MTVLPLSLVGFRGELEAAIRREQARRRRGRRVALAAGAAAAVAMGSLAALPGDPGGPVVEPASAAQRAAATLAAAPGSVVHVAMVVTQQSPDGSVSTWREESWQETAPPYDARQIIIQDGTPVETATVDGSRELYDPRTDTIYVSPDGSSDGTLPQGTPPHAATGEPYRAQILDLLRTGRLRLTGRPTVDGRRALSFTSDDGHTRYDYTVAAGTYEPIRWRFSPDDVETPAATVDFETYEELPAGDVPLELEHYHPGASVRHRT